MKYLVTGGAGFIGTNLVERLIREGNKVVVVDDLSAGKAERLPERASLYRCSVCNTELLTSIMETEGIEVVIHLAALPSVPFSIDHPLESQKVNIDGTLSMLEAVRRAKVRRVVYAASSSAYGDQTIMPLKETMVPQPKSPYGLHKYYGEVMLKLWHDIHKLETVSLRFFNVYGPHFDPNGAYALVIGKFLKQRMEDKPMTVTGDGEQTRDFVHVRDIVDALVRASRNENVGHGEVLNVGTGRGVSVNEIARMIGGPIEYIPPRIEPKHALADASYIQLMLGWQPTVKLEDGIAELKKQFGLTA